MGADYGVLPHRTAFRDWLSAAFGDGAAVVETAGVLDGGRRLFMSAKLPGGFRPIGTRGDGVDLYLSLVTSHDGSISGTALASPIRPVCANTVRAALRSARFRYAVRHTPNVTTHAREVAQALEGIRRYHEQASQAFSVLAERQLSETELGAFLRELFPDPKREEGETTETPAGTRAKRERLRELFEGEADGADLAGRTAFVDREQGRARGVDRLARSLFSNEAQDTRDRALALLVGGAA
jgi:phage/plasmid-like protein (TIGR03299 family)